MIFDLTQFLAPVNFSDNPSLNFSPHSPAASLILSKAFLPSAPLVKNSLALPAQVVMVSFAPSSFSPTQSLNSPNLSATFLSPPDTVSTMESQFIAAALPSAPAPARIRPRPSGIPTPVNTRISPIAKAAVPAIMRIFVVTLLIFSTRLFQFRATAVASEAAPASISPTPNAVPTPVKARIAPIAKAAAPTMTRIFVTVLRTSSVIEFQFRPTVVASPTAPAASNATPRPVATPDKARTAPIPRAAPLMIATILLIES